MASGANIDNMTYEGTMSTTIYEEGIPYVLKDEVLETTSATVNLTKTSSPTVLCDATSAPITVNLPAAALCNGCRFMIKKTDSTANTVTLNGDGDELLDGSLTIVISKQFSAVEVQSDGTAWFLLQGGGSDSKSSLVLYGTAEPTTEGVDGDFYIRTSTNYIYGPKAAGAWPSGVSLVGPAGSNGTNGKTILYGTAEPTTEGVDGDFYIRTSTNYIYGPKATTWPTGTSLVGPQGPTGDVSSRVALAGDTMTGDLAFEGTAAHATGMVRNTTSATEGQAYTLNAGGATSGSTDKNGGELILSSGTSTGSGTSKITLKTASAGTTGTTDSTPTAKVTILGSGNTGLGIATPGEKLVVDGNITLPKTSGSGLKVDTAAPTWGWKDLLGNIYAKTSGTGTPPFNTYRGTVRAYQFDNINDECWLEYHIPHDYVPGSDIHIHIHWSHNSAAVTSGSVTWSFDVTYAKGHNQAAFIAPITTSVTQSASTVQYQHMIAEVQLSAASPTGSQLNSSTLEIDGLILVRCYLTANSISAATSPFAHYVDIHYQSTQTATKNKAPNFYS